MNDTTPTPTVEDIAAHFSRTIFWNNYNPWPYVKPRDEVELPLEVRTKVAGSVIDPIADVFELRFLNGEVDRAVSRCHTTTPTLMVIS